nr:hypothetical protein [Bacillus wiedmannii]
MDKLLMDARSGLGTLMGMVKRMSFSIFQVTKTGGLVPLQAMNCLGT